MTIGPEHPDHPGYQRRPDEPAPQQPGQPGQPQWPQYSQQQPGYAYGYTPPMAAPVHPQANTALILGIVGLAGTFLCGVLVVLGPFAWSMGAKVKREIAASGGAYRGESEANTGMILGIVTTVLLVLAILAIIAFVVLVLAVDSSPDYSTDYSGT
ncbi:DUF4190 domain-containing protein [Nocardioides lianchengensis]|uniref:DUF4190 domain-containing protein n=1 Tax=Nocardioides lianchengensis TaxID=1045774 RepID=A0A1G6TWT4_9ACTN|nr:DUF4190 domain-containing protein [Nocardioides lianchengensis]NYG11633.1 hypothetical protein [Nocardioides lianchengensis]SDD32817.1 hypothetical protein SAMN05421872_107203 [Nocardioides lianchengensis]